MICPFLSCCMCALYHYSLCSKFLPFSLDFVFFFMKFFLEKKNIFCWHCVMCAFCFAFQLCVWIKNIITFYFGSFSFYYLSFALTVCALLAVKCLCVSGCWVRVCGRNDKFSKINCCRFLFFFSFYCYQKYFSLLFFSSVSAFIFFIFFFFCSLFWQ